MILPNSAINSVVCISNIGEDGKKYILGSGFGYKIFHRKLEDEENELRIHYLVTCKHVIEGFTNILISFGNSEEEMELKLQKYHQFAFFKNESIWFEHESGDLDLAVILINPKLIQENCKNADFYQNALSFTDMKGKGICEGDSTFVMGFPQIFRNYREEELRVLITRHGTIANITNLFNKINPDYLIDALVFPGNSGGPVLLNPNLNSSLGYEKVNDPILIGIVSHYHSHRDKAYSANTNEQKVLFEDNSGLASVYPIDFIHEITDYSQNKLKEHIQNVAKLIEKINSEEDLKEFFIKTTKNIIKSEIKNNLGGFTSENAIKLINHDIDKNRQLEETLFDFFKKNNFKYAIENFKSLFSYEYIEEYIPQKESEKILKLLDNWENKINKNKV